MQAMLLISWPWTEQILWIMLDPDNYMVLKSGRGRRRHQREARQGCGRLEPRSAGSSGGWTLRRLSPGQWNWVPPWIGSQTPGFCVLPVESKMILCVCCLVLWLAAVSLRPEVTCCLSFLATANQLPALYSLPSSVASWMRIYKPGCSAVRTAYCGASW